MTADLPEKAKSSHAPRIDDGLNGAYIGAVPVLPISPVNCYPCLRSKHFWLLIGIPPSAGCSIFASRSPVLLGLHGPCGQHSSHPVSRSFLGQGHRTLSQCPQERAKSSVVLKSIQLTMSRIFQTGYSFITWPGRKVHRALLVRTHLKLRRTVASFKDNGRRPKDRIFIA